jgi:hypothetical protein
VVIAIDESGDFNPKSPLRHYVACQIRGADKAREFLAWERSVPKSARMRGEVKGALLGETYCETFVEQVVLQPPQVVVSPLEASPSELRQEIVAEHQHYQVAYLIDFAMRASVADNRRHRNRFATSADWLRSLNSQRYLKLLALVWCTASSLLDAIDHARAGGYDAELGAIAYRIDRDFIRNEVQAGVWRMLQFIAIKATEKLEAKKTIPDAWPPEHPFVKRFGGSTAGTSNLVKLFPSSVFRDSNSSWELRVADVTAAIVRRALNRGEAQRAFRRLQSAFAGNGAITQFTLGGFNPNRSMTTRPLD